MSLDRLIILVIVGVVGYLFVQAYEPEIREMMGEARQVEVDALTQAKSLAHRTKYDQAIEMYKRVLAEKEADEDRLLKARLGLADTYEKARYAREAIAAHREILQRYPNTPEAKHAEARIERLQIETGQ